MSEYLIVGYTNPLSVKPAPLITIIKIKKNLFAQFPDCSINKLNISLSEVEKLQELDSFIPANDKKFIKKDEYSYLRYDGSIITANQYRMVNYMKQDLPLIEDIIVRNALEDLIVSECFALDLDIDLKTEIGASPIRNLLKIEQLLSLSPSQHHINFFTTIRIKKNRQKALRIIFQIMKRSGYKTVYKKNLHSLDMFSLYELNRYGKKLYNSIMHLSQFYKQVLINNNILALPA